MQQNACSRKNSAVSLSLSSVLPNGRSKVHIPSHCLQSGSSMSTPLINKVIPSSRTCLFLSLSLSLPLPYGRSMAEKKERERHGMPLPHLKCSLILGNSVLRWFPVAFLSPRVSRLLRHVRPVYVWSIFSSLPEPTRPMYSIQYTMYSIQCTVYREIIKLQM